MSWFPFSIAGSSSPAPVGPLVALDETNMTAAIKISGRAFVNAANDVWAGTTYTRYNRSRICDLPAWSLTRIQFQAISLPGEADPYIIVEVDGALFTTVTIPTSFAPTEFTVTLPVGTKHIRLIDGWQARASNFDTGVDGRCSACYLTGLRVPVGQVLPVPATAALGVVVYGDSTNDGISNAPFSWNGWAAQCRRSVQNAGGLFGYIGMGAWTLCGSGPTAAQTATMIHDLWATMGSTNKCFVYLAVPNDPRYYDLGGSVQTTPAQFTAYMGALADALTVSDPGYKFVLGAPSFPIGVNQVGPNGGNFYRTNDGAGVPPSYYTALAGVSAGRPQISFVNGTTWGLNLATDYAEAAVNAIHPNQLGMNKIAPPMISAISIATGVPLVPP